MTGLEIGVATPYPMHSYSVRFVPVSLASRLVRFLSLLFLLWRAGALADDRLVGTWSMDEGFQTVDLTFRSNGRYLIEKHTSDPVLDPALSERGRYWVEGSWLVFESYEYFGEPARKEFVLEVRGEDLVLTRVEFEYQETYRFQAGSRAVVMERDQVEADPIGRWQRARAFSGTEEYTFRPGGYFVLKRDYDGGAFPPEFVRGRYRVEGTRLALQPYSGVEAVYELDFFGRTLTLIREEPLSGDATAFEQVAGSPLEVRAKSTEAEAFLARTDWQVGEWEIRDLYVSIDVTFRPDGHYQTVNHSELLRGTVRGRFELGDRELRLLPFVGQGIYARSNGDFGKIEQVKQIDYYDGELQFIDPTALSQSVLVARKTPGSESRVREKAMQAMAERAADGWYVGVWEVRDPVGWMRFTLRPDRRYIVQAGTGEAASSVERGWYGMSPGKATLAPYSGQGPSRGFEVDLYDGDLFLVGDLSRMVIARKVPGSEVEVTRKTRDPESLKGERGGLLGLWTANRPGHWARLVFRDDGQFRLEHCVAGVRTRDYGLYSADVGMGRLRMDSRFTPEQSLGLDFYGSTVTLYGGASAPATYHVNLGMADAAMADSWAEDAAKEVEDDAWRARVPIGPRDPGAVPVAVGDIPADPRPELRFPEATVLRSYRLYRRLIPGFVYFNVLGTIKSVAVVNTREWHFFPTGRVLVRFKNYYAAPIHPNTLVEVSDNWGAYRLEPVGDARDILHLYADEVVRLAMDSGETAELTLEDGRRHLFWEKDFMLLSEWATEQKPIPCDAPPNVDAGLMNTGVALATGIPADPLSDDVPVLLGIGITPSGDFLLRGKVEVPTEVVVDRSTRIVPPIDWRPAQTNAVGGGTFEVFVTGGGEPASYFRLRRRVP